MDLSKSLDWFNPAKVGTRIHIIGCGSVGSTVGELLARFGIEEFSIYDIDTVERHNIVNQMFTERHLRMPKVDALESIMMEINPAIRVRKYPNGWNSDRLNGYVFLAVDNIELRRRIVEENYYNPNIKAMFDFRTGLTTAQHFAADWTDAEQKQGFLNSMLFTQAEADRATPVSACHVSLCVAPTVRIIANVGVMNFINHLRGAAIRPMALIDIENHLLDVD